MGEINTINFFLMQHILDIGLGAYSRSDRAFAAAPQDCFVSVHVSNGRDLLYI